jgi:hypothetical protein
MIVSAQDNARNIHAQQVQQHDQHYLPEIQAWQQIMAGNPATLQGQSTTPQQLMQMQQAQFQGMESALQSGAANINGASNALVAAVGKSPDLSGAASAFSKLGGGGGGGGKKGGGMSSPFSGGSGMSNQDDWWNSPEFSAWQQFNPLMNGQSNAWDSWDSGSLF